MRASAMQLAQVCGRLETKRACNRILALTQVMIERLLDFAAVMALEEDMMTF